MDSCNIFINLLLTITLCFFTLPAGAQIVYLYTYCPNSTTYPVNSIYDRNLNSLLSSLSSNSTQKNGFYNTTAGQDPSNTAYGLYLCRGDVAMDVCQDCVVTASKEIVRKCPRNNESVIYYDECMLRYSNKSFFSQVQYRPWLPILNTQNVSEVERFMRLLEKTMNDTAARAANDQSGSGKKFATGEVNFTSFQSLYTLVQCTPDLSAQACNSCLHEAIARLPSCCEGKRGGRSIFPSCNVIYELYQFYRVEATAPAPSPVPVLLPPAPRSRGKSQISTGTIIAIVVPTVISVLAFAIGCCLLVRKSRKKFNTTLEDQSVGGDISTIESLQFDFGVIEAATNKFSYDNKLGEGGFGVVYKGILPNGQEIAVKRLSLYSGQGLEQFKNEVVLVSKLQHRNLVRLLGFCVEGEEKILIYEFVPNKSLDYFLFDPEKQGLLDWSRRYKILGGIARGILYLHEDSRLRIIHRDLKTSNILLDADLNSKISDFGMAKILGVDQTQDNTNRIVGTYGYLSPEYAMHGQYSLKSDIYSFGVIVLEIISGKKISSFDQSDDAEDLLSYAWKHWSKGTALQFMDEALMDSYSKNEVIRCLQLGLLCVQENPAKRPTMGTIVLMLDSYSVALPMPQKPAFFLHSGTNQWKELGPNQTASKSMPCSVDEASITEVYPR
ncbi:hypothetical protein P3X46_033383 [Hevea brasiliensis]|uniref:Cysteine-rich receptor-like protein kinase 10 n=1 Tax=Hevea brasiliensis TaxID=3981 RepID=A0ABQ9KHG4_HEVBR|nr:cysteine-rich receptor-like protein kinase 10 [Hevea brasiliensis]KAJ9136291.1 hypothetical protein P3X46_033383 [Hevea brasiliensis]